MSLEPANRRDRNWDAMCRDLEDYKAAHGHSNVPRGSSLGAWVHAQRTARKKDRLSGDRVRKLDRLGMNWGNAQRWDERLDELTRYKAAHGHCKVAEKQGPLGTWVLTQRKARRRDKLSEDRVRRLDELGFDWGTARAAPSTWDNRAEELARYKAEHGHCTVPQSQGTLGSWVNTQRQAYKKSKLSEAQVRRLDDLGFNWGCARSGTKLDQQDSKTRLVANGHAQKWETRFRELEAYKTERGDCNISRSHGPLGKWADTQRLARRKGKMSDDRFRKLDGLGFKWGKTRSGTNLDKQDSSLLVATGHTQGGKSPSTKSHREKWNERYHELETYKVKHGHCNVPQGQRPLGKWVNNQRQAYKKSKLSEERVQKLDCLGFNWGNTKKSRTNLNQQGDEAPLAGNGNDQKWHARYRELMKYKADHGDCNVPQSNKTLFRWVGNQRSARRKDKLSKDRVQKLDNLGFNWRNAPKKSADKGPEETRMTAEV